MVGDSHKINPMCVEEIPNFSMGFGLFLFFLLLVLVPAIDGEFGDAGALLALKSEIDPSSSIQWDPNSSSSLCSGKWQGVKECNGGGRVTKLVLEYLNLTGTLKPQTLAPLDQLRVLSFKSNSLFGPIPDLTPLYNLKSIYLNNNRFTGKIPNSLALIHRLKIVVLSDNQLTGEIPSSFVKISRLYTLLLQNNRLTGQIPSFQQQGLRFFNVSNNDLSGEIPQTKTLARFNISSFLDIPNLCGDQISKPCPKNRTFPPSTTASSSPITSNPSPHHKRSNKKLILILACSISGCIVLAIVACMLALLVFGKKGDKERRSKRDIGRGGEEAAAAAGSASTGAGAAVKREFSWENEGLGKLVFCGGVGEMYSLEDLLKASAETLGRGTVGSTYKAVMESGFIVTVKRLKDSGRLGVDEFRRKMEEIGILRHPNLVPLRAYFQAKEERLLVYDYFPNGSLFSLIHGTCSFALRYGFLILAS